MSIFLAAFICGELSPPMNVLLACLSGALITSAANAINDVFDIAIDRINKPQRPLPSGIVSVTGGWVFSMSCFAAGIALSWQINIQAFIIAAIICVLLFLYSAKFKRTVLAGNFIVSLATGMAFIYGGVAIGRVANAVVPATFAFLMHLGREIVKDMEDVRGDRANNALTLPVRYGLRAAKWTAIAVFAALFFATMIPFLLGMYGIYYLVIVMLGVNTVIAYSAVSLCRKTTGGNYRFLSALLKADMLMGLLAIYAGRW
jgi:geranylgeranylglycerol-phosphate geranylgeranyltransferase